MFVFFFFQLRIMRVTIAVTITTINNYWTRLITLDEKLDLHVSNSSCNAPIGSFATDTMLLGTSYAIFSSCNKTVKLLVFSVRDIAVPFLFDISTIDINY